MRTSLTVRVAFAASALALAAGAAIARADGPTPIGSCADFYASVTSGDLAGSYILTADIDCSEAAITAATGGTVHANDVMVGSSDTPFTGTFDGDGYGVTLELTPMDENYVALFRAADGATFQNLDLHGSVVAGISGEGILYVGALVGQADNTVFDDVDSDADVTVWRESGSGGALYIGGVAGGVANSTSSGIDQTGDVTADDIAYVVGGVFGRMQCDGTLDDSTSQATVLGKGQVGGFVGALEQCSAETPTVSAAVYTGLRVEGSDYAVGGIVGEANHGRVIDSRASGAIEAGSSVGGIVGNMYSSAEVRRSTSTADVTGHDSVGGLVGNMTESAAVYASAASGAVTSSGGATHSLGGLVGYVDGGQISGSRYEGDIYVEASGDVSGVGGLVGYSSTETSIGDCYASGDVAVEVSGASSEINRVGGLIGALCDEDVTCSLSGSYHEGDVSVTVTSASGDASKIGGLVGYVGYFAGGWIAESFHEGDVSAVCDAGSNCSVHEVAGFIGAIELASAESSIGDSYAAGAVAATLPVEVGSGADNIAGVIGYYAGGGAIARVYHRGSISVSGGDGGIGTDAENVGGFAGDVEGDPSIEECFAAPTMSFGGGATVIESSVSGFIAYQDDYSGVTGNYLYEGSGDFNFCYTEISGQTAGCTLAPSAEVFRDAEEAPVVGWDLSTVWTLDSRANGGYPILRFVAPAPLVAPTVATNGVTDVGRVAATLVGEISDVGDSLASARGFEYGETESYGQTSSAEGEFSAGEFSGEISGLTCGTTYHFRAFAESPIGTGYGDDATFETAACEAVELPHRRNPTGHRARSGGGSSGGREPVAETQSAGAATGEQPGASVASFSRDLEEGLAGDDVLALQNLLIARATGPAAAALAAHGATGYFGPLTRAAVAELQAALGVVPAAGYFGPRTRAALGL